MKKGLILAYAAFAYLIAMANIAYIVAFLADYGVEFGLPKTINTGEFDGPLLRSMLINALLVLGFGMQHSITARRSFKAWWTRLVPAYLERATYLYMTAAMTALLVTFWQPIPITIWQVEQGWAAAAITSVYLSVWVLMVAATFHFGHFGFFGLAQAWARVRERSPTDAPLSARYLYALMRHPISFGWLVTPWLTPHMTIGQAVFGASAALYIVVATRFEEADLIQEFGASYEQYRREVPAFFPRLR